ncbi:hypothetical protein LCGC14_1934340 [marine sediment metagenome]|uniref:Uncharacterized protein n=1 Tax=marine sediment metagenome TaxID=412755 RepID=A0A0F9GAI5_9ZZZZ
MKTRQLSYEIFDGLPRMMYVTPKSATFSFLGLQTGVVYPIEAYISDVANANVRFDSGGGASATSAEFWTPPENVQLRDFAQVVGPTVAFKLRLSINGVNAPGLLRFEMHLSTLSFRPPLSLVVPAGGRFSAVQLID